MSTPVWSTCRLQSGLHLDPSLVYILTPVWSTSRLQSGLHLDSSLVYISTPVWSTVRLQSGPQLHSSLQGQACLCCSCSRRPPACVLFPQPLIGFSGFGIVSSSLPLPPLCAAGLSMSKRPDFQAPHFNPKALINTTLEPSPGPSLSKPNRRFGRHLGTGIWDPPIVPLGAHLGVFLWMCVKVSCQTPPVPVTVNKDEEKLCSSMSSPLSSFFVVSPYSPCSSCLCFLL
ncbi:hypothetical protein WMY93_029032 [Mugilogobius chulae]|uniref:Uncharacterized protein n=1 Tax=Mugilogobius chulae TaxID=88201 RepID=A0AAW0N2B9_9GOBI